MLLAIDSSTARLGLALYDGTQVVGEMTWAGKARHTQELAPALSGLLTHCGIGIEAVHALGVALGPGSFTSLRVGLAFAKGLALARRLPMVGIPSLDITAAGVPLEQKDLAAVLQAGRGRLAVVWYKPGQQGWVSRSSPIVLTAEELEQKIHKPVIICGELSAEDRRVLGRRFKNIHLASAAQCVRRPGILAELAWECWQAGQVNAAASLAPIYLHTAGGIPA